jgi:hypothetical protein
VKLSKKETDMTIAMNEVTTSNARRMRDLFLRLALVGAFTGMATILAQQADARPGGGGGPRGGLSMPRGGGGGFGRAGGVRRPTGVSGQRPSVGTNRGTGPMAGQGPTGVGQGNRPANAGKGNTGIAGNGGGNSAIAGNRNGNTGVVGSANANSGTIGSGNGNTGVVNNGNVVAGNNVDVDIDNGWGGWDGDYPAGAAYATGVAVGATTAAVVGSYYSTLPAGCSPYVWAGAPYYSCGSSWYQRTNSNGSTVYVVVSDPRQ